jgi:hypothetical protein
MAHHKLVFSNYLENHNTDNVQGAKCVAANLFDIFFAPTKIFFELRSDVRRTYVSLHVKCPLLLFLIFFNLRSGGWNQGPLDTAAT